MHLSAIRSNPAATSHTALGPLEFWSKLECAVNLKYTLVFKDLSRKKKRESTHINAIRIQWIISIYHEKLYTDEMRIIEEMDTFLERCNLPTLNQEEIKTMSKPITSTEIESVT